ncbi:hypothetical protein U1Q18_009352 [Sarracenia purpurea var. burkii]
MTPCHFRRALRVSCLPVVCVPGASLAGFGCNLAVRWVFYGLLEGFSSVFRILFTAAGLFGPLWAQDEKPLPLHKMRSHSFNSVTSLLRITQLIKRQVNQSNSISQSARPNTVRHAYPIAAQPACPQLLWAGEDFCCLASHYLASQYITRPPTAQPAQPHLMWARVLLCCSVLFNLCVPAQLSLLLLSLPTPSCRGLERFVAIQPPAMLLCYPLLSLCAPTCCGLECLVTAQPPTTLLSLSLLSHCWILSIQFFPHKLNFSL